MDYRLSEVAEVAGLSEPYLRCPDGAGSDLGLKPFGIRAMDSLRC